MTKALSKKTRSRKNLDAAWRVIYRNGHASNSIDVRNEISGFANDPTSNISSIQRALNKQKFDFGKAKGVPVKKFAADGTPTGKIRPLVLAPLEARIVQRAILNVLTEIPRLRPYFETPYSFGGVRKIKDRDAVHDRTVSGAIEAALEAISTGAKFFATADIAGFFTKIPKARVRSIIASCTNDSEFLALYDQAVKVELGNLEKLRELADEFPKEDIGVAQGSSLSPLIGNIVLKDFDDSLNTSDCTCIRYIDDFIILGPSAKAVDAKLASAIRILDELGMTLEQGKSVSKAKPVTSGFDFLGISVCPGIIRPGKKSAQRLLQKIDADAQESLKAMRGVRHGQSVEQQQSVVFTLKRIEGRLKGWRKHYWFCNDLQFFGTMNDKIHKKIYAYLGCYRDLRSKVNEEQGRLLLGLSDLRISEKKPFIYPKSPGESA